MIRESEFTLLGSMTTSDDDVDNNDDNNRILAIPKSGFQVASWCGNIAQKDETYNRKLQ